jgi:hypothetical protein
MTAANLVSEIKALPKECLPEVYDFVSFLKTKQKGEGGRAEKESAFGCLNAYADSSKIPLEKGAWEREVAGKHAAN